MVVYEPEMCGNDNIYRNSRELYPYRNAITCVDVSISYQFDTVPKTLKNQTIHILLFQNRNNGYSGRKSQFY